MRTEIVGVFFLMVLCLWPSMAIAESTETGVLREEISILRERLERLEKRLAEQEKAAHEAGKQLDTVSIHLKEEIEEKDRWYKNIALDGAIVAVAQGSDHSQNDAANKTDGNLRLQLGLTSTSMPNGTMRLEFRQGRGTGLGTEVDSFTGINDTVYDESADIYEAWYEHRFFGEKLRATIGKMDFTNYFDGNEVAHCECTRFMSAGFIWNPAVEWVSNSPGVILNYDVRENLYLRLGAAGTSEWENIAGHPFAITEIGLSGTAPCPGNYRFYAWLNSSRHDKWQDWLLRTATSADDNPDAAEAGKNKRGWGAGFSFDQEISEDISLFARLGYRDADYYRFNVFWSLGGQIAGRTWSRPRDSLGVAYGVAALSSEWERYARASGLNTTKINPYISKDESHLEIYYRFQVNDHLSVSPDFQVLFHPLGDGREDEVYIGAVRGLATF